MSWLSGLLGTVAPIAGSFLGGPVGGAIGSALGGAIAGGGGSSQSGTQTTTQQQQLDPRIASMLFGDGTDANKGLLSQYQGMLGAPQNEQLAQYGKDNLNYLGNAPQDLSAVRGAANGLIGGNAAPTTSPSAWAVGNQVQAPSQNGMDLSGSYKSLIDGPAGANPYLTGAIGKGINQSNNAFGNYLSDATKATQDVLGGIRSNSVLAGQYGGSRQGIAEGKAIESMNTQLGRAASQFGQNNTDAAVAAQAGAYDSDRNRQLAATQGLGAQQYGLAAQNAATKNQAEFMNVGNVQQSNLANQGAQLQMNQLNQNGKLAGAGLLSGQMAGAYGVGQNQDAYSLNQAGKVNGLLSPYVGLNGTTTQSAPLYQNQGGNILGGAAAGLGLYNQFKGLLGNNGGVGSNSTYANNDYLTS